MPKHSHNFEGHEKIHCILLGCFFPIFILHAQEPGTVIELKITPPFKRDYKVWVANITYPRQGGTNATIPYYEVEMDENEEGFFRYSTGTPYYGEIYDILIKSGMDSMNIRFRMDVEAFPRQNVWNAYFTFDIPFHSGYFEITGFETVKGRGFTFLPNFKWFSLPKDQRKLM